MIRLLIATNSTELYHSISDLCSCDSQLFIVGQVLHGAELLGTVKRLKPQLVFLDLETLLEPGCEGIKQVMAYTPIPIALLTSSQNGQEEFVFKALSYGALDVLEKNALITAQNNQATQLELLLKIKRFSNTRVIPHPLAKLEKSFAPSRKVISKNDLPSERAIGIISSTGGPQALHTILKVLPEGFSAPVFVVQHLPDGFTDSFAQWLHDSSSIPVVTAKHHEKINPGTIYIAPCRKHMRITQEKKISLSDEDSIEGQRPSGTLLLQSLADTFGSQTLGIVLTGMGKDGAQGLAAIHKAGGLTLAQSEESCIVYGMPKVAIDMGVVREVLSPEEMSKRILRWVGS